MSAFLNSAPFVPSPDAIAGGGGRTDIQQLSAWFPPATPDVLDDEFANGTALDAAWAVSAGAYSATAIDPYAGFAAGGARHSYNSRRPGWLLLQPDTTAGIVITKLMPSLPADYAVWARSSYNHRAAVAATNNDFSHAILLTTEPYDTNNRLLMQLNESDAGVIQAEFSQLVGGVGTSIGTTANLPPNEHTPFEGCLIQKIGAIYHGWAITNNGSCVYVGNTATFTPVVGRGGMAASNAVTTGPGNMIMGFDFFRVNRTAGFLP